MKKILVLGVTGMLGSMVYDVLSKNTGFDVRGTARDPKDFTLVKKGKIYAFDAEQGDLASKVFSDFTPDYIVNCIGIIKPYCKDNDPQGILRAIKVNALFPYLLASTAASIKARVIQIATDCVYSGTKGKYTEKSLHDELDVYGKTKSLGEVALPNFLNIRCSIIGPEPKNKVSLLEWFLSRKPEEKLTGFTHHTWNGVTTLQFAEICQSVIERGDVFFDEIVKVSPVHHLVINETVNKFELLNIFNKVFDKKFNITAVDNIGAPVDRSIASTINSLNANKLVPMEEAISNLKKYMSKKG